jgi:hypothetical protein
MTGGTETLCLSASKHGAQGGTNWKSPVEVIIPGSTFCSNRHCGESQHSLVMGTNQEEQTESVFFDREHSTDQARGILVTVGSNDGKTVYSE